MACCPSVLAGPVSLTITHPDLGGRQKFETEGDVTTKPKTFTIEDRDSGRGHRKTRNNSYIEGTITLTNGGLGLVSSFRTENGFEPFNDVDVDPTKLFCICGAVVNMVDDCGNSWTMYNAAFTGDGTFNSREGTMAFRFSSPFEIIQTSGSQFAI